VAQAESREEEHGGRRDEVRRSFGSVHAVRNCVRGEASAGCCSSSGGVYLYIYQQSRVCIKLGDTAR
jgi:hypothetical protein